MLIYICVYQIFFVPLHRISKTAVLQLHLCRYLCMFLFTLVCLQPNRENVKLGNLLFSSTLWRQICGCLIHKLQ